MAQTNICWRYAVKPEQGVSWTRYTGNFPFPESHVGTLKVTDTNNQVFWLIIDNTTGTVYLLANRDGPSGSGITKEWLDKVTSYGGVEIPCTITLKEHSEKSEKPLQHQLSNLFIRPYVKTNKGRSGYLANGLRGLQQINARVYEDGNVIASAEALDLPADGDVSYDKKIEAERIQMEYSLAASEFKIVGFSQSYLYQNRKGNPSQVVTSEQDWQNEFGLPVLWLSRGQNLLVNRATGSNVTGTASSTDTGPDRKTQSAMVFSVSTGLSDNVNNLTGNFSIVFSLSSITQTTTVLSFSLGNGRVRVVYSAGTYYLEYRDFSGTYSNQMTWSGSGWVTVSIARTTEAIRFTENGSHLQQFSLPSIATIGGDVQIMNSQIGSLFDVRILAAAVSNDAVAYYYSDLTNNNGNSFLPTW